MNFEITQEMVEGIIERKVEEAIDSDSVRYLVRERVNSTVDDLIRKHVKASLDEKFRAIAEEEAGAFIDKEVKIYDGWGSREHYETYADFYAAQLRKRLERHEIERTVQAVVKNKVEESIQGKADSIIKRICNEIIVEAGGEENDR